MSATFSAYYPFVRETALSIGDTAFLSTYERKLIYLSKDLAIRSAGNCSPLSQIYYHKTYRGDSMRTTIHNTPLGHHTDHLEFILHRCTDQSMRQYYCQGVYCSLSTTSEMFLIFTTRLLRLYRITCMH